MKLAHNALRSACPATRSKERKINYFAGFEYQNNAGQIL